MTKVQRCGDVVIYKQYSQSEIRSCGFLLARSIFHCLDFSCVRLILRPCDLHEPGMTHIVLAADANQGTEMPKTKRPCYEGVHVAVESAVHDGTYWLLFE